MFSWARKERLSERTSIQKLTKSCTETKLHSLQSSPAHSNYSVISKRQTPQKKLKIMLYNKQKSKQSIGNISINIQNNMQKSQLMKLITQKNNTKRKRQQIIIKQEKQRNKILQNSQCSVRKVIKIKIQVNRLIDQYCRIAKQAMGNNVWGIFVMGSILLKMGFLEDMINERWLIRQIWQNLDKPDLLGLYIFLELVLGNRIHLDMAINTICHHLNIKIQQFDKAKAILIISDKKCCNYYNKLRLNRLGRHKTGDLKQ